MFDICKIYPIWIPPCKGDIWWQLNEACREVAEVIRDRFATSVSNITKVWNEFRKALEESKNEIGE